MPTAYRFLRKDVKLPPAQLIHADANLSFFEDHVDGFETLTLQTRESMDILELDSKALEILEVRFAKGKDQEWSGLAWSVDPKRNKLVLPFGQTLAEGTEFRVFVRCKCIPSDTILDGLYRDVTPVIDGKRCPRQYMSQCQQWGFRRILPIIDDCTAKCTFRTTLEGDARYTHLISNGDPDRTTNPDGVPVPVPGDPTRRRITYVNPVPMAPYLFIACAGTWDELSDEVSFPIEGGAKTIRLSYLVPPGKIEGARKPMDILKRGIIWQHERLGYLYPYETYRTITMEKSNCGGMENVGNTTIVTEAALIDETTTDPRILYAHGVIAHEYEHNHCGSGVTMESPFDMWLNEAYTVDIERQFVASVFQPDFARLQEVDGLRIQGDGPFALEDSGTAPYIVRDGFDDPDEVVDGVTYDKAPEVLNMLRRIIGQEAYDKATKLYFSRYDGKNANTEQFLACFEEVIGRPLTAFTREWLFTRGYPTVTYSTGYDRQKRELTVHLAQTRCGDSDKPFVLPLDITAVNQEGRDLATRLITLDSWEREVVFESIDCPAYLSLNRNAGFYGFCQEKSDPLMKPDCQSGPIAALRCQVMTDQNLFNRVEAMRMLTDLERLRLRNPRRTTDRDEDLRLDLFKKILKDDSLPDGIRGYLLRIEERPRTAEFWDPQTDTRNSWILRENTAKELPIDFFSTLLKPADDLPLPKAVERRFLQNSILQLLSALYSPYAYQLLEQHLKAARNITDHLNTLTAIWKSHDPKRAEILAQEGEKLRKSLGGHLGFLQVIGQSPRDDVFEFVDQEAARPDFDWSHPGMIRALFTPLTRNNNRIWTEEGTAWLEKLALRLGPVNEYTTLRLLGPALTHPHLCCADAPVRKLLERLLEEFPKESCGWIKNRVRTSLEKAKENK